MNYVLLFNDSYSVEIYTDGDTYKELIRSDSRVQLNK
jgi:hypothetical protein